MPKRPKVLELPQELRAWLDQALIANGFGDYNQLAAALEAQGHKVGKSSLQRYGSVLERRLATLKVATDQANAIVKASPDDEGAMNEALIRLTQEKLFSVLLEIDVDPKTVNLTKLTKSIADLARSSVTTKRFAGEVRQRAEDAAANVERIAKKGGLSAESVQQLRREILGIAA